MTLDRLEAYRADRTALEAVNGELAERETQVAVQSAATPPYSLHTATLTGLPPTPRVISLLERQAALRASCFAVERFAENLDDPELREIVRLRFMSPRRHSWQEIALALGYRAEHTPKRKLAAYLEVYNMNKNEP
jgi:hypothetical protein